MATQRKPTPGPWTADGIGCVRDDRGEPIMTGPERMGGEAWANALLIAAAPDLYEALKRLVDANDAGACDGFDIDAARAALAKAEGRDAP